MKEEKWIHPEYKGHELITVTLKKGEHHECSKTGYVSRGAGHVFVDDNPQGMTRWTEYDLNDEKFLDIMKQIEKKGWIREKTAKRLKKMNKNFNKIMRKVLTG